MLVEYFLLNHVVKEHSKTENSRYNYKMNFRYNHIAIVRLSALGDIVNTKIVLQFIKKHYPQLKIDWISEAAFAPLLDIDKNIYQVHSIELKKALKTKDFSLIKKIYKQLRALPKYDLVIDTQGLIKSAVVAKIIGAPLHGFSKDSIKESIASLLYNTTTTIAYEENIILRNCFVVSDALDFKITKEDIENKAPLFDIEQIESAPYIVFVIGASWESKIYPKEKFAALCSMLPYEVKIIWGDEREKRSAQWIVNNTTNASLAPKMNLVELVSFIGNAKLLVGNDTGPTHMAWGLNIPSVTIFGPTNERMIYQTAINIAVQSDSKVDVRKINKQDFSIKEIAVETLAQKIGELLK